MTTAHTERAGAFAKFGLLAGLFVVSGCLASSLQATAAEIKTVVPGKLTIGMNGDMPMTQIKDGQLSGTDGELMVYVAKKLGLEPSPQQMDWAAEIESTKQGKLDIMHGAMGWLEARTKIMILSEPI
jgi:polar amino acid transport system substrate-binding protein